MKCLSLKQPYAYLLASGAKTVEIRKWSTKYRGEFLIHASKDVNKEAIRVYDLDTNGLVKGAIIGKAYLYDVKKYDSLKEFIYDSTMHLSLSERDCGLAFKRYGFMIHNSVLFESSIPYSGKLGFFDVDSRFLDGNNFQESIWYFDI